MTRCANCGHTANYHPPREDYEEAGVPYNEPCTFRINREDPDSVRCPCRGWSISQKERIRRSYRRRAGGC